MKWFRLHTDILDDPKMFELNNYQFRTFIKLLCIASKSSADGSVSCSDHTLIRQLSYGDHTTIRALSCTLSKLHQLGIIDAGSPPFKFINWNKRQYKSDYSNDRVKKHREMKRSCSETVTPPDYRLQITDTDTEINTSDVSKNPEIRKLSELLFNLIQEHDSKAKNPNWNNWDMHIDRLIRLDNRTIAEVESVIRWCQADDFWHKNILSTETLRRQFQKLFLTAKGGNHGKQNSGRDSARDGYRDRQDENQLRGVKPTIIKSGN
jgi:hypothetical protein